MSSTILLTGATGFLGSEVARQLLQDTDCTIAALVRGDGAEAAARRLGVDSTPGTSLRPIERATNGQPSTVENMSIDHCRFHVFVAEEFLDRSDVIALF